MEDIGLIHGRILVMNADNTKKNPKTSPEEKKTLRNAPEGVLDLEELDMVSGGDETCCNGVYDSHIEPPCTNKLY